MVSPRFAIIALLVFACSSACARARTAEQDLRYYVEAPVCGGDVFTQGKLDGVDYRKLLRGAIAYDKASLLGIFRYTATRHLMGEGAETNCSILHDLLEHWGDSRFAAVLSHEPSRLREIVIAEIGYTWRSPGWQPTEFPKTYRLATHKKISTSTP